MLGWAVMRRRVETNLAASEGVRLSTRARAHGMRTYEPRQGRKAATVVCSASAVVTLAFSIYDFGITIYEVLRFCGLARKS